MRHGRHERDLHGVRAGVRGAVPLPDGGAGQRVLVLLLAGLPRQEPPRRDNERRRLRLLQQTLRRRARLAGRPDQGRGALRVLRGLPRAAAAEASGLRLGSTMGAPPPAMPSIPAGPDSSLALGCDPPSRRRPRSPRPTPAATPAPGPPTRVTAHARRQHRRPAQARDLQSQGRHRQDDHVGQHRRRPRDEGLSSVLLVDTDSQGNVGVSLGVKAERSLYHVLVMGLKRAGRRGEGPPEPRPPRRRTRPSPPPSSISPAARTATASCEDRLARRSTHYDVVLLDCSPSLSLMNQNALVFADGILVPVACDFLSLVGVRQVIKTVKNVNSLLHHPVQIYGVLPTFYDARARICRDAVGHAEGALRRALPPADPRDDARSRKRPRRARRSSSTRRLERGDRLHARRRAAHHGPRERCHAGGRSRRRRGA